MKNLGVLILFAVLSFNLSACKKRSNQSSSNAGENYKGAAVKGDWKVEWLTANPENLNPIVSSDGYARDVTGNIFDTLLSFDVDSGEPVARLAEAWSVSKDGLIYEFKLRKDVQFQDGKPMTGEDLKFTFDIIMNPKTDAASLRNYMADVKSCDLIDPYTVRFTMKRPYFRNLIVLGLFEVLPKHIYGVGNINTNPANRAPIGTGPYKFSKWETGRLIELVRDPNWWGNKSDYWKGRHNFDKILFRVITEQAVAAMAFKKGEIDSLEPTPTMFLNDFVGDDFEKTHYRVSYTTEDGNGYRYIGWNLKRPLFQSKELRLALAHLMPREEINSKMFNNLLTPAVSIFPAKSSMTDPSLKAVPYDKKKASELLAQAGWKEKDKDGYLTKDGKRLSFEILFSTGSAEAERIALIYQQSLKEVGVDMRIRTIEWTVFLKQRQERKFDALMMSWTSSLDGDPYQVWHSSQEAGQGSNVGSYSNNHADELMERARSTLDRAERNKLYQDLSKTIFDDQPYLFLFERPHLWVGTKRFAGVLPVGKIGMDAAKWFSPPGSEKYKAAAAAQ